jgi:hypothetical protein
LVRSRLARPRRSSAPHFLIARGSEKLVTHVSGEPPPPHAWTSPVARITANVRLTERAGLPQQAPRRGVSKSVARWRARSSATSSPRASAEICSSSNWPKRGRRFVVFKNRTTYFVFIENDAHELVKICGQAMMGHLRRYERIAEPT